MTHVPHQLVFRGIENIVQGDGQFDRTQPRRQVAAGLTDAMQQILAQLLRQLGQLVFRQGAKIRRVADGMEQ